MHLQSILSKHIVLNLTLYSIFFSFILNQISKKVNKKARFLLTLFPLSPYNDFMRKAHILTLDNKQEERP